MQDTYLLELARPSDAATIATMSRDFIEHGFRWAWTPERVRRSVADAASNVLVAREGDAVVGFGIMKYAEAEAHLMLFGVVPAWQRRGVGTALLGWLESTASCAGIELIFLEARFGNVQAREFYRRRGYRELAVLPRYYQGREDAVRIGKDLLA
jgi:ribosomal-protein-alanine N-acetyltransferase